MQAEKKGFTPAVLGMALIGLLTILTLPIAQAKTGHLPLLAVSETETGYEGSPADLYLEIRQGSGRVFIDSFPLTKLDTQISTRFAKQIACKYTAADCDAYDFFYTIRADSTIIGGPSAGAAVAALTAAMLENHKADETIAITGTVNSGGIIGPVGGLKEKIDAATEMNIHKVLIPFGTISYKDENNETTNLVDYGRELGISVVEVSDLDDVLYELTGKKKEEGAPAIAINPHYTETMGLLAERLCSRTEKLRSDYADLPEQLRKYDELEETARNLSRKGTSAMQAERLYAAASYCFGANTNYRQLILLNQQQSKRELAELIAATREEIDAFDRELPFKYETITDLQTYAVVKERIIEAHDSLDESEQNISRGELEAGKEALGYAIERFYSAESWSEFFNNTGSTFDFNQDVMKDSCMAKILEAEERFQYVSLFFPGFLLHINDEIQLASLDMDNGDYELCLFKASKAKAESDIILSTLGVEEENIGKLLDKKLEIVQQTIAKTSAKGAFPIIGYSYYEYAESLRDDDTYSALLYAEYALELSNLDIYFEKPQRFHLALAFDGRFFFALILGATIGFLSAMLIFRKKGHEKGVFIKIKR